MIHFLYVDAGLSLKDLGRKRNRVEQQTLAKTLAKKKAFANSNKDFGGDYSWYTQGLVSK